MKFRFSSPQREVDQELLDSLIQRFVKAKWITGLNVAHPDFYRLNWTELGKKRMGQLGRLVRPFADNALGEGGKPGFFARLKYEFCVYFVAHEVRFETMPKTERHCLCGLAALFDRDNRLSANWSKLERDLRED